MPYKGYSIKVESRRVLGLLLCIVLEGEPHLPGILFPSCLLGKGTIELGPTALHPPLTTGEGEQGCIKVGNYHVIINYIAFRKDSPIGVQDHGIACTHFIVILSYPVAEDEEHSVVMGTGG